MGKVNLDPRMAQRRTRPRRRHARRQPLSAFIDHYTSLVLPDYLPMVPTLVRSPFHVLGWVYEEKVDGYRMSLPASGSSAALESTTVAGSGGLLSQWRPSSPGCSYSTARSPSTTAAPLSLHWLRESPEDDVATSALLIAFDVIYVRGLDISQRPAGAPSPAGGDPDWRRSRSRRAPASANGLKAWAQVLERGYEGMVGTDEASAYVGGRTRSWLKVKVPGWTDAEDRWCCVCTSGGLLALQRCAIE